MNLFLINDTPRIYNNTLINEHIIHGQTEFQRWGNWRESNSTTRHSRSCFDVEVSTNEIGARDESFISNSLNNIILLGDSFAEGFGVEYEETAQYLIEQSLGKKILNFGAAGFGPLQELIIYKTLASKYSHEELLIFVLPANDFTDNEREFWENDVMKRIRYRPYYSRGDKALIPYYFPEAIPTEKLGVYEDIEIQEEDYVVLVSNFKKFLINYTWSANTLRSIIHIIANYEKLNTSYFVSATEAQQMHLVQAYNEISKIAKNKPVHFVVIPEQNDIEVLKNLDGLKTKLSDQKWYAKLSEISKRSGGTFIDLLNYLPQDYSKLFLPCDGHWSPEGNKWAADIIIEYLEH